MTLDELRAHVAEITYRPGWTLEVVEGGLADEGHRLRIVARVPNAYRPDEQVDLGIDTYLPPMPDGAYFDQWLAWRLARVEVHESAEYLRRNGKPIFDPHGRA